MEIQVLSVPYDSGVPDVRMGTGPARLLEAGLERRLSSLGHAPSIREVRATGSEVASELATAFDLNATLAAEVRLAREEGRFPIVLAGSCYSAVGTMAGLAGEPLGVIWMDTHADLNTPETTASGFLDGMAVSILTGESFATLAASIEGHDPLSADRIVLVGTRDVDPAEAERIRAKSVTVVPPAWLDDLGDALGTLRAKVRRVYLHVDLDVLDPDEAPANTFVAPDGLSVEELVETVRAVRDTFEIAAISFTAYDPSVDPEGRVVDAVFSVLDAALGG